MWNAGAGAGWYRNLAAWGTMKQDLRDFQLEDVRFDHYPISVTLRLSPSTAQSCA
jgi:hypothetical protein